MDCVTFLFIYIINQLTMSCLALNIIGSVMTKLLMLTCTYSSKNKHK